MSLEQVTELVTDQGKAWAEFQKANDARLKSVEERGYAPSDLVDTVAALNAKLTEVSKNLAEVETKSNRPNIGAKEIESDDMIAYKKAFDRMLRKGKDDGLEELQLKAMNTGSDPDGGYIVIPEMDRAIDRVAKTMGGLAAISNNITIGTAKYEKLVKTSGMAMRRVADGQTGGESTEPTYKKVAIEVFSAEVEPWVYNETLEDSFINLESDLAEEAAIGFAEGANAEYITGNGVGKSRGILGYTAVANASYAWGKLGYVPSGATSGFASSNPGDKIINLQHALKAQYRPGASFLMNDATLALVRQFKDASGNFYLWNPDPSAGFSGRILGSPVTIDDNMPDVGTGAYALAFGNFKRGYTIVNRAGTTLIRDNITAKGTTKFNFRRRFGAGIVNYEAIKLMKFATS